MFVGKRITGNRHGASQGLGYDLLHVAIDDATRLADVEGLADEKLILPGVSETGSHLTVSTQEAV